MPVELKDLAEYLGYNEEALKGFENVDAFKAHADKEFIRRANATKDPELKKQMFGEVFGIQETKVKQAAKKFGIEFKPEEIKDKSPIDIAEIALEKFASVSNAAMEDLKGKVGKPDKMVQEWEEKYNKLKSSFEDTKNLLDTTKNEFTSYQEKTANEIKNAKLNFQKEQLLGGIQWKPGIKDIEKQGFLSIIEKTAKFDFDENNQFVVKDAEGRFIPNKAKHGEFMKPDEWLKDLAVKSEVVAINPHANGKPQPKPVLQNQNTPTNGSPEKPLRKIGMFTPNFKTAK